jgi:hypothetical protein
MVIVLFLSRICIYACARGETKPGTNCKSKQFFFLLELPSVPRVHSFGVSSEISLRMWLMFVRLIKPGARHCDQ